MNSSEEGQIIVVTTFNDFGNSLKKNVLRSQETGEKVADEGRRERKKAGE